MHILHISRLMCQTQMGGGYKTYDIANEYRATLTDLSARSNDHNSVTQDLVESFGSFGGGEYTSYYLINSVPNAQTADLVIKNIESVPGQVDVLGDDGSQTRLHIGDGPIMVGPGETVTLPIPTNLNEITVSEMLNQTGTSAKFTLQIVSNTSVPNRFKPPNVYQSPERPSREQIARFFQIPTQ